MARGAAFIKALKAYIAALKNGTGKVHTREQLRQAVTVDSHEPSGLRQKEKLRFVEMDKWKLLNKGKTPLPSSVDKQAVLQKDGSTAIKEGVWESNDPEGIHQFERYRDEGVTTKRNLHDSEKHESLGEEHAGDIHAVASSQLKIGKPMTLDDLAALVGDEPEDDQEPLESEAEDSGDDGTDDERT